MLLKGESHIDFHTQCVITTLAGGKKGEAIINDVLNFRKFIQFEKSCIVISFFHIYLIFDRKRSFNN